jgi:hypothetical protein
VAPVGEERKVYRVLVGKPERKRPLGKPRRWWGDGTKIELCRLAGGGGVDWIHLTQDWDRCWWAVMSAVMNLQLLAPRSYCFPHYFLYCICELSQFEKDRVDPLALKTNSCWQVTEGCIVKRKRYKCEF